MASSLSSVNSPHKIKPKKAAGLRRFSKEDAEGLLAEHEKETPLL